MNFIKKFFFQSRDGFFVKELTASDIGYKVEADQAERLLERFKGFSTVKITDLYGRPVTMPLRKGADGGIDLIFTISAPTEAGMKVVYGKVKRIILDNDY